MAGPTPVSALIHAATMVTAGVYLVVRMHPVFEVAPWTLQLVGTIGAITGLYASLCACSQTDLKRVLAYSTVSQIGYMFLACGAKAYFAAMFHLTTHAFVKALLFLSAGNAIHMLHGTTEMAKMGGLSKYFKKTDILFLIGALAMSGIPPLAIFFSKDLIIEEEVHSGHEYLYFTALIASFVTAFYLTRAYFLTFRGPTHVQKDLLGTLHDAPRVMLVPVAVLGVLAILGGFLGFARNEPPLLMSFLEADSLDFESKELILGFHLNGGMWLSIAVAFAGFGLGAYLYTKYLDRVGATWQFFYQAFYINQIYNFLFVKPLRALSRLIATIFEPKIFDSSLRLTASTSYKTARALQAIQSGQIRSYISWIVLGAAFFIIHLVFEAL